MGAGYEVIQSYYCLLYFLSHSHFVYVCTRMFLFSFNLNGVSFCFHTLIPFQPLKQKLMPVLLARLAFYQLKVWNSDISFY